MIQQPHTVDSNSMKTKRFSRKKLWLFRLLAITLSVLILFVAEGFLRLCGVGQNLALVVPVAAPTDSFTHEFNSSVEHAYYKSDLSGPEVRPFKLPKPKGTYRIVVLGASTVIGFPYPPELAFPRQIEVLLEGQSPELDVEVLNAGITSLNSYSIVDLAAECLQSDPDLMIVYAGHNEFYGPGGVSSNSMQISSGIMQWTYSLRRLRISQLADMPFSSRGESPENLMDSLPRSLEIPLGDPVIDHARVIYERNLNSIVATAKSANVPIILSTVACNSRDQSPMRAIWPPDVSTEGMEEWNQLLLTGESFLIQGDYTQAKDLFSKAAMICQDHARLVYRQAQCAEGAMEINEARLLYGRARDLDACRFRAPSFFSDVVRSVSTSQHITLVDIEKKLDQLSPAGSGYDWFLEHVHFRFAGHRKVALFFAQEIQQTFLKRTWNDSLVPEDTQFADVLGVIPEDHLTALTIALEVLETAPNAKTLDKKWHRQHLLNEISQLYHQMEEERREAYANLPMDIASSNLLMALIRAHTERGNHDLALELATIAVKRRPWDMAASDQLKQVRLNSE